MDVERLNAWSPSCAMFCGQQFCMLNAFPLYKPCQLVAFKCKQTDIEYLHFKQSSNRAQLLRPARQPVAQPGRWSWKWRCETRILCFELFFCKLSCTDGCVCWSLLLVGSIIGLHSCWVCVVAGLSSILQLVGWLVDC